MSLQCNF